jgi:hypothetical protein
VRRGPGILCGVLLGSVAGERPGRRPTGGDGSQLQWPQPFREGNGEVVPVEGGEEEEVTWRLGSLGMEESARVLCSAAVHDCGR